MSYLVCSCPNMFSESQNITFVKDPKKSCKKSWKMYSIAHSNLHKRPFWCCCISRELFLALWKQGCRMQTHVLKKTSTDLGGEKKPLSDICAGLYEKSQPSTLWSANKNTNIYEACIAQMQLWHTHLYVINWAGLVIISQHGQAFIKLLIYTLVLMGFFNLF